MSWHNAPVICKPCPPPTTYGDGRGIAGLMCEAMTFWVPPQWRVSAGLVILRKYTPSGIYSYKEQGYDSQQVPAVQGF